MNNEVKNIANNIRQKAGIPENETFGSVIAILMVISIILTLIRVFQECNKNKVKNYSDMDRNAFYTENIHSYSKNRGWFTKLRMKRIIKKQMSKEQYAKYGNSLLNCILDEGENLTEDQTITLVEASNV
jgi:hypothetical protein